MAKVCVKLKESCPKFVFGRCIGRFYCKHEYTLNATDSAEFNSIHWGAKTDADVITLHNWIREKTK